MVIDFIDEKFSFNELIDDLKNPKITYEIKCCLCGEILYKTETKPEINKREKHENLEDCIKHLASMTEYLDKNKFDPRMLNRE